ncbi:MAG: DUF58 domain-containing protein [Ilumatobacter sp.]|uniref:DUF58 domain-containing protein n=1 Tax=Ilumatobacter sp. TaxID=1967498 RepID=UPI002628E480|nr:DUF58 domain-containing protein [Ilumatobacter sp.]MDJ0769159.1 DUF58 domain-containing protein [Ilumatobacter sp.]
MTDDRRSRSSVTLHPERDERLLLYGAIASLAVSIGLIGGGLRLIVIGVPFVLAMAVGARRRPSHAVAVEVTLDTARCVEGDRIGGRVDIAAPDDVAVEIAIERSTDALHPPDDQQWAWSVPIGTSRPVGMPFEVEAGRWGRHTPGAVDVRLIEPGSLFGWRGRVVQIPEVTVLPAAQRLDDLLALDAAQVAAGAHPARRLASSGYEFSEVREYRPGDRLRDLNWSATLRHDELHVNRRTPERGGDVVILIDSFPDAFRRHSVVSIEMIRWAGRTAWSIASAHLAANDRVGIAVEGTRTRWLPPQAGRRAKLVIFDTLLQATASSSDRGMAIGPSERIQVPPAALVVAISPLARPRTLARLHALRADGHAVEILALDAGQLLATHAAALPEPVVRLRDLVFEERVAGLRRTGLRVTVTHPGQSVGRSIRTISRARQRIGRAS